MDLHSEGGCKWGRGWITGWVGVRKGGEKWGGGVDSEVDGGEGEVGGSGWVGVMRRRMHAMSLPCVFRPNVHQRLTHS